MNTHHIGLEVQDIYAAELFYRQVLGFDLDYRYSSRNTPGLRTVFLSKGETCIELLTNSQVPGVPGKSRPPGWGHISLEVGDVDAAWEEFRNKAAASGYSTEGWKAARNTGDGFREALILDPEGTIIELGRRIRPFLPEPIRAVIFDFDGILINSIPNYFLAMQRFLARRGIIFSEADNQEFIGQGNHEIIGTLKKRHGLSGDVEVLIAEKDAIYLELAKQSPGPFLHMHEFLDMVRQAGLPLALASGSSAKVMDSLLPVLGLEDCFKVRVSSESVPAGKPAPDVFLAASNQLGIPAINCLVVEDSAAGVEAAVRAGMRCLAVPSFPGPDLAAGFQLADHLVADGMTAFSARAAMDWLPPLLSQ